MEENVDCCNKGWGELMGINTMHLMRNEAKKEFMVSEKPCLSFADGSVLNLGTGGAFTKKEGDEASL
jgi:hypothetical protein